MMQSEQSYFGSLTIHLIRINIYNHGPFLFKFSSYNQPTGGAVSIVNMKVFVQSRCFGYSHVQVVIHGMVDIPAQSFQS